MSLMKTIESIFPEDNAIPAGHLPAFPVTQSTCLVDGELRPWKGPMREVFSPLRTGKDDGPKAIGGYPLMGAEEALAALDAAARAYDCGRGAWPTATVAERIRCVERFAFLMKERREEVVNLLMWEIGKSLADSAKEFDRTIEYIGDTIDALKDLDRAGSRFEMRDGIFGQVRRAPLGVVLCMGPFNYPLNETLTTLIPALIMGNTAIVKPPRYGVLLYGPLMEAFREAFPKGVVNFVYGDGATVIGPLMESGRIDVLAFIGSSRVADILKKQHPKPHRLRCVLGLDAKNAAIVLRDADIDLAVRECLLGALSFNGQRCTAIKIIWVHRDIAGDFVEKLGAAMATLAPGMPWDEGVKLTPLPEEGKTGAMKEYLEDAAAQGARIMNEGGGAVNRTFMFPALVYPVNERMRLWREEQFGPVVPVVPFAEIAEPLDYVIQSNFGQQVAVFGNDPGEIARLVDPLVNQVCRVNINSQCQRGPDTFPFTGRKDSAEGTLSVSDALRVFTIRTLVAFKGTDRNKEIITEILREKRSNFLSTDFIF